MKIELENGSTIETRKSKDAPIRRRRARLYDLLNAQCERELTEDEKKVIESFMVKDPPDFKKEYGRNTITFGVHQKRKMKSTVH